MPAWAASRRNSTRAWRSPRPSAGGAVDDAEQRPDRELEAGSEPRAQLLPAAGVHADLARATALAVAYEQRAAPRVEVALAERQRLGDAQAAAPEHDHQSAEPVAVGVVAGLAHHGDDLFHARRVSGIEPPLVAGRASGVVAGQGRRRTPPTGGIEHCGDGHGISSQSHNGRSRSLTSAPASPSPPSSSCTRFATAKRKPAARQPDSRLSSLASVSR